MNTIQQSYTINAPIEKVWESLTSADIAEQWGASPAKVDAHEGGKFSYWDGDIHGVFTKLVPEKLIEQDWYGHDNPTWKYRAVFTFESNDATTTVHLEFSGDIQDEQKDIADWKDYYFDPIKKLLEQ
jgi:uncharacterized protein YndB with AHSA1/START domain